MSPSNVLIATLAAFLQQSRWMATQSPLSAPAHELLRASESLPASDIETLGSNSAPMMKESPTLSPLVVRLPLELEAAVPVHDLATTLGAEVELT